MSSPYRALIFRQLFVCGVAILLLSVVGAGLRPDVDFNIGGVDDTIGTEVGGRLGYWTGFLDDNRHRRHGEYPLPPSAILHHLPKELTGTSRLILPYALTNTLDGFVPDDEQHLTLQPGYQQVERQ